MAPSPSPSNTSKAERLSDIGGGSSDDLPQRTGKGQGIQQGERVESSSTSSDLSTGRQLTLLDYHRRAGVADDDHRWMINHRCISSQHRWIRSNCESACQRTSTQGRPLPLSLSLSSQLQIYAQSAAGPLTAPTSLAPLAPHADLRLIHLLGPRLIYPFAASERIADLHHRPDEPVLRERWWAPHVTGQPSRLRLFVCHRSARRLAVPAMLPS